MKTICVCNQKGGVGKTTTSLAIAEGLTLEGYSVVAVDMDSQGSLSLAVGVPIKKGANIYGVMTEQVDIEQAIKVTKSFSLVPGSNMMATLDLALSETIGGEFILRNSLKKLEGIADYVVIDCPPSLGKATINSLIASDYVVIPAVADLFSLIGLEQLKATLKSVQDRKELNPNLKVLGILLTQYSGRTNVEKEAVDFISKYAEELNTEILKAKIRPSCKAKESVFFQQSVIGYAPNTAIAQDYKNLLAELHKKGL